MRSMLPHRGCFVRSARAIVTAAALPLLTACSPLTVSFTLGEIDRDLKESTVLRDDAASNAKIAMIPIEGLIVSGDRPVFLGTAGNPVDQLVQRLEMAEKDNAVKAVVIRVNSPGGGVAASEVMYSELRRFRERSGKPIVISMGDLAASGGYYASLAGDYLFAQPTTITGSIGVIVPTINFSGGLRKIGIQSRAVKSGENKDLANPLEPSDEEHYRILQGIVDEFYGKFRTLVVERRPALDSARLDELTDGRIVTGEQALAAGLIDGLGGVREAFDKAKALASVPSARLVTYTPKSGVAPKTPYATGTDVIPTIHGWPPSTAGGASTEINLVQINAQGGLGQIDGSSVAYYVWMP